MAKGGGGGGASLRNAVKRVTHKERAQPASRKKFGLLEKHKDYKERADDFHRKVKRINDLKKKAAVKNPDEFYFGMVNSTVCARSPSPDSISSPSPPPAHPPPPPPPPPPLSAPHRPKVVCTRRSARTVWRN